MFLHTHTGRQVDRQTQKKADKQIDKTDNGLRLSQTHTHTGRHTDRLTGRQIQTGIQARQSDRSVSKNKRQVFANRNPGCFRIFSIRPNEPSSTPTTRDCCPESLCYALSRGPRMSPNASGLLCTQHREPRHLCTAPITRRKGWWT